MSTFKVGERVVCVDDSNQLYGGLVKGEIYEVTNIHKDFDSIYIKGFSYSHWNYRFRKLDTQFAEDVIANLIEQYKTETIYS